MMRVMIAVLMLLMVTPVHGQDDADAAYQEALRRIVRARVLTVMELDLLNLSLDELPPEIGQLSDLQVLDIRGNNLSEFPSEIWQLSDLQSLWTGFNNFSVIPPEIGQLSRLQVLYLNDNDLTVLPPEIGQLSDLQVLDIRGNNLSALPSEIGQLSDLQVLDIRGNNLSALPSEIGQLTDLRELSVGGNQLTYLPPTMRNLRRLDFFYWDGNIMPIPDDVVGQGIPAQIRYLSRPRDYTGYEMAVFGFGLLILTLMGTLLLLLRLRVLLGPFVLVNMLRTKRRMAEGLV